MRAKLLILGFAVFLVVFAGALWWFQTRAFYEPEVGVTQIVVQGQALPVAEYRGVDAESSPLKLRACFRFPEGATLDLLDALPEAAEATPLVAPAWVECFDARVLSEDLAAGRARAVLAAKNDPHGFDRFVMVYPDGRGFMWRQLNEIFQD